VRAFHDSPGLVRCFNQLAMVDRAYVQMWEASASAWVSRLIDLLRACESEPDTIASRVAAYGFLSFIDAFLHALYIDVDPILQAEIGSPEEATERIAVLWRRVLIGGAPADTRLAFS
jgi:hypothetical protein